MEESLDSDGIYQGQNAAESLSNSKNITTQFDKIEDQIKNSGDSELLRLYGEYLKSYQENQAEMNNSAQYNSNMGYGQMDPRTGNTIRLMTQIIQIAKSKGITAAPAPAPAAAPQKQSFMQRTKQKLGFNEDYMEEGWGDENLVNKLKNRIADLEEKLENCTGPDFSNVSNGFHNIPGREIQ